MTKISLQKDPNQKVFCYIDFLKPGRHVYAVSHQEPEPSLLNMYQRDFYVHDLLATFRNEKPPNCKSNSTMINFPFPLVKMNYDGSLMQV